MFPRSKSFLQISLSAGRPCPWRFRSHAARVYALRIFGSDWLPAYSATRLHGCKSLMIGSLYSAVDLARQMQKATPSQAPEIRRKRSFPQILAAAMRVQDYQSLSLPSLVAYERGPNRRSLHLGSLTSSGLHPILWRS